MSEDRAGLREPEGTGLAGPGTAVRVVGLGLMGGSVVRDLSGLGVHVLAWSPVPGERRAAAELPGVGVAESLDELLGRGTGSGDPHGLLIAAPLGAVPQILDRAVQAQHPGRRWVQDLASLQLPPLEAAAARGLSGAYVSAHPLVGGQDSGFSASRTGLYRGGPVYLSHRGAAEPVLGGARDFWARLGGHPRWEDPHVHDERMGMVSHLPQVVATHLAHLLAEEGVARADLGPGGRDVTRLAGSDPVMWRDLLSHSGPGVARALASLAQRLGDEARRLDRSDASAFTRILGETRAWFQDGV